MQIDTLENELVENKMLINDLKTELTKSREDKKGIEMESETQKAEINDYKLQIEQLNERLRIGAAENNININETLEQQKQYEARVDKIKHDMQVILEKFTTETNANAEKHRNELKVCLSRCVNFSLILSSLVFFLHALLIFSLFLNRSYPHLTTRN